MLDVLKSAPQINGLVQQLGSGLAAMHGRLCEIAGYLKPAQVPNVKAGSTTGAGVYNETDMMVLLFQTKRLDITLFDNGVLVRTSANAAGNYDAEFELIGPGFYSFPLATRRVQIRRSGAAESRYSLVGWT